MKMLKYPQRKPYIKNLEYKIYQNFGKWYLSLEYDRGGEFNRYTIVLRKKIQNNEASVRRFINNH